ncbi:hypothetical protein DSO57_1004421 [Entomophthora muscae]|uniref:Uncharacterized protein n=1 Tax=Entomophthora muscae TaxID=34485 RepID=A0ACC2TIU1_9FUNG|nr:hypothetical protein DSO57_1004421 [Entomophthora muscae]
MGGGVGFVATCELQPKVKVGEEGGDGAGIWVGAEGSGEGRAVVEEANLVGCKGSGRGRSPQFNDNVGGVRR